MATPQLPKAGPPKPSPLQTDISSTQPPPVLLTGLAYLALGVMTSFTTVLLHARWYGLTLGLLATAAILLGSTPRWWARLAFSLGWVAFVAYASTPRPEGDYVFARTSADYLMAYVATPIVLVVGVSTTALAARHARAVRYQAERAVHADHEDHADDVTLADHQAGRPTDG